MGNHPDRNTQNDEQPTDPFLPNSSGSTTYQNGALLIDVEQNPDPQARRLSLSADGGRRHSRTGSDVEAMLPFLQAAASSSGGFAIWPWGNMMEEPKEECKICLMEHPVSEMMVLESCGHRFCKECLTHWYTNKITEGEVDLVCMYLDESTGKCMQPLSEEEIQAIVSAETFSKYERFKRMQDKLMRECPFCSHTQRGDPKNPEMVCENCGQIYCFLHSNAHPNETCEEYTARMEEEFRKNREAAGKDCKECPGCGIVVEKTQGCNHMTCTKCKTEFCYVCGADITGPDAVFEHYRNGDCQQFDFNLDNNPFFRLVRSMISLYMAVLFLPMILVAFVLCIPLFPVAFCRSTDKSSSAVCRYWRNNYFFMCNQWIFIIFIASPLLLASLIIVLPFSLCLISPHDGCEPVRQCIRTVYSSLMMILMVTLFFPLMAVLFLMCCCVCLFEPAMLDPQYGQQEEIPRADRDDFV